MPNDWALNNCFRNNPDGAGFMYSTGDGKVYGEKGFFSLDSLQKAIRSACARSGKSIRDMSIVIHFRFATHGNINAGNCHPFPLSGDYSEMQKRYFNAPVAMCHNGVISFTKTDEDVDKYSVSDTMVFLKKCVFPKISESEYHISKDDVKELGWLAGGKLAFLDGEGNIMRSGTFVESSASRGVFYSNWSYTDYSARTVKTKRTFNLLAPNTSSAPATCLSLQPVGHMERIFEPFYGAQPNNLRIYYPTQDSPYFIDAQNAVFTVEKSDRNVTWKLISLGPIYGLYSKGVIHHSTNFKTNQAYQNSWVTRLPEAVI